MRIVCTETSGKPQPVAAAEELVAEAAVPTLGETPNLPAQPADITTISNIFGGGELLES